MFVAIFPQTKSEIRLREADEASLDNPRIIPRTPDRAIMIPAGTASPKIACDGIPSIIHGVRNRRCSLTARMRSADPVPRREPLAVFVSPC